MNGSNIANRDQEIAENRERFNSDISDEDRKRLLLLLGAEMDKACITWQPGAVINPVLRAILRAERDTRERDAQLYTDLFVALEFAFRTMEEFEEHERRSVFTFAKEKIGKVIQRGRAHSWEGRSVNGAASSISRIRREHKRRRNQS